GVDYASKEDLLRNADIVTIHLQLGDRSRGLLGGKDLALMKPTAYLINTSRGPIVDEKALVAALAAGRIAGAGLDVFDVEPLPLDHPLRKLDNVVLTPHLGYVSAESYKVYYSDIVANIRNFLDGKPVKAIARSGPTVPPSATLTCLPGVRGWVRQPDRPDPIGDLDRLNPCHLRP